MTEALSDLLTVRTKDDELQAFLSVLQGAGFPVTDWEVGGTARTWSEAFSSNLADHGSLLSTVTAARFVILARDLAEPTWLDLLAENFYGLARARATYTKQRCLVTCDLGLGPQIINAGFTARALGAAKNVYIYQGGPVTVPDNDSVTIEMQAESPGSTYDDPANTITELVTPLPGLSINNPAPPFGGLSGTSALRNPANQGSGAVTPSAPSVQPVRKRFYAISVLASGAAGMSGQVEIDYIEDGTTFKASTSPIPTTYILGDGITLTFADGVGAGFIVGDRHTFATPGTPITANGVDDESQKSLADRCLGRWPSLGLNIVGDKYKAWVNQCSVDNALGIEKVTVSASHTVAGQTDILLATATGAPGSGAISTIQDYLNARDGVTDSANVAGAVNAEVTMGGTVTVKASNLLAAQAAADSAWRAYIRDLPIGGDISTGKPGVVRLSELYQAVMDAGVIDFDFLTLFGAPGNMTLDPNEVAVIGAGDLPSEALTWQTVA